MSCNTDGEGRRTAFSGRQCDRVTVDGTEYVFADSPVSLTFGPVKGDASHYRVRVDGNTTVRIPVPADARKATVKVGKKAVKGAVLSEGSLVLDPTGLSGQWLDVTFKY